MMMASDEPAMRLEVKTVNMGLSIASPTGFVNPCGQTCGQTLKPLWMKKFAVD
jgi:hypothetical protein